MIAAETNHAKKDIQSSADTNTYVGEELYMYSHKVLPISITDLQKVISEN